MEHAKRMDQFKDGIFTVLAEIKNKRLAQGKAVYDFSVGTPNIPPAPHIMNAIAEAAKDPKNYVYAISDLPELQDAISDWYKRRYQVTIDPRTQVTSLLGSQEGLGHIALAFADEGDIVLVPDPCYPVFQDGPKIAGAKVVYMPMKKENDYLIQFDEIDEEVAKKAKMMIVSYPNNPTSVMAPDSWYKELIQFAKKYNIMVLHDNAYSELVYDGKTCGSFLRFEGAMDVGVEFNSLSKTYGLAGARIGICVGNPEIVKMVKKLKSNMDYGMFIPVQKGAIAAICDPDQSCVTETGMAYQKRRDLVCDGFKEIGWDIPKCSSTMFLWAPIPAGYANSNDFAMELVDKTGMLVAPGSAFGPSGEGNVRLALVRNEEEIAAAIKACKEAGVFNK